MARKREMVMTAVKIGETIDYTQRYTKGYQRRIYSGVHEVPLAAAPAPLLHCMH
jgi:hypothetical protein